MRMRHPFRKPTEAERQLVVALAERASGLQLREGWLDRFVVEEMNDGGMGSLRLSDPSHMSEGSQRFGRTASEYRLRDEDGVEILASLNLDTAGEPFELDMWKVDFSPVIRVPTAP